MLFWCGFETKIILPANYGQSEIVKLQKEKIGNIDFEKEKIPYPCEYLFFYKDGKTESNMDKQAKEMAMLYKNGKNVEKNQLFGGTVYNKLMFKDGECVVKYEIKAQFNSKILNKFLNLGVVMTILSLLIIIGSIIFIAIRFGKRLKKEIYPLLDATERIKNRDLEFDILKSGVKEFNNVLTSIDDMKKDLRESLKEQWILEKEKEDSINALAHDIKTPLTIIKGNTELLLEGNLSEEEKENVNYIFKNAEKIEGYVELLIETSGKEKLLDLKKESIKLKDLIIEVEDEMEMLCNRKNITYKIISKYDISEISINKELLIRAFNNIIANAVEYSPENSSMKLYITEMDEYIEFKVSDRGCGFSSEGLKKAINKFYMEASERKVGKHYGLGLYIANSIGIKHGGSLIVKNNEIGIGAEVSLRVKIFK